MANCAVAQVNSQLMEAIQQKVELSQQLDQWQQDMQELLEEQMNRKMVSVTFSHCITFWP